MNISRIVSIFFCSLISISSWAAGDLYVSTSGSDSNSGTQSAPFRTILKASQAAGPGSTVHVAPGTYAGGFRTSASGTASARIRYVSDTKWGAKIVPSSSNNYFGNIWYNSGDYVTIDGFEVDGSVDNAGFSEGIYTDGSYTIIQNNHVHHIGTTKACTGAGGAGIGTDNYNYGVNDDVIGNLVHHIGPLGCEAFFHGIYLSTTGNAKNNIVHSIPGAGITTWHNVTAVNVINNTSFNNGYGIIIGAGDLYRPMANAGDYCNIFNNIVFNNTIQGISEQGITGTHNTYVNNLVFKNVTNWQHHNGTSDSGTISADPQFVNYIASGGGDYRLKSTSPAIDRGTSSLAPSIDIAGVARPQGAGVDIGAYEYGGSAPTPTPTPVPPVSGPSVSLSPSFLDFGSLQVGATSSVKFITIANTGGATLTFNGDFVLSGSDFAWGNQGTCAASLAPAASCTASLVFKPSVSGVRSGSLAINDNAADSPRMVPLSGTGISASAPAVSLSPASLNFGSLTVGTSSSVQFITVTNTGNATLNFNGDFVLSGSDFGWGNLGTCAASLAPGASCTASLVFKPSVSGVRSGSLAINDNAAGSPHIVQLSGTGLSTAPVASVSASPTSLSFGRVRVGRSSSVKYVTITNTGKSIVTFGSDSISGDFVFANLGTCDVSLAVGAKCTFSAKFVPKATGYRSGAITISTSASSTPIKIPLSGRGY